MEWYTHQDLRHTPIANFSWKETPFKGIHLGVHVKCPGWHRHHYASISSTPGHVPTKNSDIEMRNSWSRNSMKCHMQCPPFPPIRSSSLRGQRLTLTSGHRLLVWIGMGHPWQHNGQATFCQLRLFSQGLLLESMALVFSLSRMLFFGHRCPTTDQICQTSCSPSPIRAPTLCETNKGNDLSATRTHTKIQLLLP